MRRSSAGALVFACLALHAAPAHADTKAECLRAHEDGQMALRAGDFDRARRDFASCQRDECAAAVRARCADFALRLEAAQPTVVVLVHDAQGDDVPGAHASLDGAPPEEAAAFAIGRRMNPGVHALRVEAPGFVTVEKSFTLPEGEKAMPVTVTLERPKLAETPATPVAAPPPTVGTEIASSPPPDSSADTGVRKAAWGFAIGSGVALIAAGTMSGVGWSIHSSLRSSCGGSCSESQVDPLRVLWPGSFVALGLGVGCAVVSAVLFLQHPGHHNQTGLVMDLSGPAIHFQ